MENKKLPFKAFVIAVLIGLTRLLSPESAEARPIPPGITSQDLANMQNQINESLKSNRDRDPLQWATRVKENMMRGGGDAYVGSRLHIHLDDRGRIIGKATVTSASPNMRSRFAESEISETSFVRNPQIHRTRVIKVISDISVIGDVVKKDLGTHPPMSM